MRRIYYQTKNLLWRLILRFLVNPKKVVEVEGNKMFLDARDSLLLSLKKYEPKQVKLIKSIVKKGDTVLDIGANIGYYTLLLAKLVGPTGKVYAFEPDPENFRILKKNVGLNKYKNIVLEQKAVSNKSGKLKLFLSDENNGDHRIYNPSGERKEFREISSIKLDNYFKRKPKIAFFKMDIQGVEPDAFEGMKSILNEKDIKFTTEFSPENLYSAGRSPLGFIKLLNDLGFSLFDLDAGTKVGEDTIKKYEESNYFTTILGYK